MREGNVFTDVCPSTGEENTRAHWSLVSAPWSCHWSRPKICPRSCLGVPPSPVTGPVQSSVLGPVWRESTPPLTGRWSLVPHPFLGGGDTPSPVTGSIQSPVPGPVGGGYP